MRQASRTEFRIVDSLTRLSKISSMRSLPDSGAYRRLRHPVSYSRWSTSPSRTSARVPLGNCQVMPEAAWRSRASQKSRVQLRLVIAVRSAKLTFCTP